MNVFTQFYLWCGCGGIVDLESAEIDKAILAPVWADDSRDWTLWRRSGFEAELLATKVGGKISVISELPRKWIDENLVGLGISAVAEVDREPRPIPRLDQVE